MSGKRLLLLQLRPEDAVADDEYHSILAAGVSPRQVTRIRMDQAGFRAVKLDDYAAVIVGGGPSNVSDPLHKQPAHQRRYEPQLYDMLDQIVASDFPFLGICYGMGLLTKHQGGVVSKRYAEPVGAIDVVVRRQHKDDKLVRHVPESFKAYVGHKEAVERAPGSAVILASSASCPVQLYRIGSHVYATQFHPELTADSLALRIRAYKDMGYFAPEEADGLIEEAYRHDVSLANTVLRRFLENYL